MVVCLYYLQVSATFTCDKSLRLWLYTRTFFSLLISTTIVFFMTKISQVYEKEQKSFEIPVKIMPKLENNMKQYDFWIRRKSLLSTSGILLLFLGLVSLFWSCLIVSIYHFQDYYFKCELKIQKMLNVHSFFIIAGNLPLVIVFLVSIVIKISAFICAFLCPKFLISLTKMFGEKKMTVELIKYC